MGYADRVRDTTATTGTGNLTLSGSAPTGFRAFGDAFAVGDPINYCISATGSSEWEVGRGYLSGATTFVRDHVLSSSNSGSLVNFSAGTKDIFCTQPADKIADAGIVAATRAGILTS